MPSAQQLKVAPGSARLPLGFGRFAGEYSKKYLAHAGASEIIDQ